MKVMKGFPRILMNGCLSSFPTNSAVKATISGLYPVNPAYLWLRNMNIDIGNMRISYDMEEFTEENLVAKEPIGQFKNWFETACKDENISEANAMCLSTAFKDGRPSSRMVLLKGFNEKGFKFFTNYDSKKGKQLAENPIAALMFYWEPMKRQVRIEGLVEKLSEEESVTYFNSRPRESRLGACASNQSQPVSGKQVLADKYLALAKQYEGSTIIPKPDNWGGFCVVPDTIEFWQGQKGRMHDRIQFRRQKSSDIVDNKIIHQGKDGWVFERLSP